MATWSLGIIMNGVTGRMGTNQHLIRSIPAIRAAGGVALANGDRVMPDPILVGRDAARVARLAGAHGVERWATDLDTALANDSDGVFFDAAVTQHRAALLHKAIAAGKHVYCEKPSADSLDDALAVARAARAAGIRHGVVQDKLFLPGLRKLQRLIDGDFFGRILSVRGEFGYWVFEGDWQSAQRPSWNYRKSRGGGIILDMLCHWRYVLDNLFGPVHSVCCLGARHVPKRWDETGAPYDGDAAVRLYSGDDFNYPELIAGDEQGHSDALLGIFDAIAPAASAALDALARGDPDRFHSILAPTVPLSRHMFRAPTRFYKTSVVFLAWLNGHQDHFVMVGGQQSARSLLHLAEVFRLADAAGLLSDPEMAAARMRGLLALHGIGR